MLFINDIAGSIRYASGAEIILYADDLTNLAKDSIQLVRALSPLEEWSSLNKMVVNTRKTKIMKFRRGGRLRDRDFTVGNSYDSQQLDLVNEFTFLGIILQTTFCFQKQVRLANQKRLVEDFEEKGIVFNKESMDAYKLIHEEKLTIYRASELGEASGTLSGRPHFLAADTS